MRSVRVHGRAHFSAGRKIHEDARLSSLKFFFLKQWKDFLFGAGAVSTTAKKLSRNELSRLFCKVIQAIKYLRWSLEIVLRCKIPGLSSVPCFTVHANSTLSSSLSSRTQTFPPPRVITFTYFRVQIIPFRGAANLSVTPPINHRGPTSRRYGSKVTRVPYRSYGSVDSIRIRNEQRIHPRRIQTSCVPSARGNSRNEHASTAI